MRDFVDIAKIEASHDFIDISEIKTTGKSLYNQLNLMAKVELYDIAKKFQESDNSVVYVPAYFVENIYKSTNNYDNSRFFNQGVADNDILYLGPTDYKILLASASNNIPIGTVPISTDVINNNYVSTTKSNIKDNYDNTPTNATDHNNIKNENFLNKNTIKIDLDKIFTEADIKLLKKKINKMYTSKTLSKREKISIQNQFMICYKNAILKSKKQSKFDVAVILDVNKNCFIDVNNIKIKPINYNNKSSDDYKDTINNVKLAINYCNPIRNLPLEKYESWKKIKFMFNSR